MSTGAIRKYSEAEYLQIERESLDKHQFYQGEMFQMAGASRQHNRIVTNLIREVSSRLKGGPCQVYPSDLRVHIPSTGLYTYPDVTVVCGEEDFIDDHVDTLTNPTVIFEVLSDSTEKFDRGAKFRHYRSVASLRAYVLVAQNEACVDLLERIDEGHWKFTPVAGLEDTLHIETLNCDLPLAEIYANVEFPLPTEASDAVQTDG